MNSKFSSRKLKMGGLSTALVVLFLIGIVLINVIASVLVEKIPLNIDLTRDQIFALSQESRDFAASVSKPVEIKVLATEENFLNSSTYNAQANEVIKSYAQYGKNIDIEYIDYVKNPTFATRYPDLTLAHGDILIRCEGKNKVLKPYDLFNYTSDAQGNPKIASSKAEQVMTSAIVNVSSDEKVKVAVLSGHGEYTMDTFTALLDTNNFELIAQNLATEDIDPDAKFALLLGPKKDLEPDVLKKLDVFLENGGNYGKTLLYTADAEQPVLPNLEAFLVEWGIQVGTGAVFETSASRVYNYNPFYPVTDYVDEEYADMILTPTMLTLVPLSKPINALWEYRDEYSTRILLQYGESAGVRPADADDTFTADNAEQKGPFPALILSTKTKPNRELGAVAQASHVLVSGSSGLLDGYAIDNTSFANSEYLLNLFHSLSERKDIIKIPSKTIAGNALNMTQSKANGLGLVFALLLPLAILGTGIVIWMYRRHK
ncbi:GldG family protein [Hydrogenoanaerobacterium sp.]|uniref:GldG family protein n=1 Tax=Hydrogenoanaerobacterium sp. TaxID=2953763 RepID=UPI00289E7410|nr:GldG family protein [Hydrogenoanaerobacterium sp.]